MESWRGEIILNRLVQEALTMTVSTLGDEAQCLQSADRAYCSLLSDSERLGTME